MSRLAPHGVGIQFGGGGILKGHNYADNALRLLEWAPIKGRRSPTLFAFSFLTAKSVSWPFDNLAELMGVLLLTGLIVIL